MSFYTKNESCWRFVINILLSNTKSLLSGGITGDYTQQSMQRRPSLGLNSPSSGKVHFIQKTFSFVFSTKKGVVLEIRQKSLDNL